MKKTRLQLNHLRRSTILTPFLQLMDGGLLNLFWNLKNIIKSQAFTVNNYSHFIVTL